MKRFVLFGSSGFGRPAFETITAMPEVEVVAVVSQPDRPLGRRQTTAPTPVSAWARQRGVQLIQLPSLKTPAAERRLADFQADVYVVAAYGLILPPAILQQPTIGSVNIHASLLPKFRGASPISAAIIAGESTTGITYLLMDAGVDTGPILREEALDIHNDDTRVTLEERLSRLAAESIATTLTDWWAGRIQPRPQPAEGVSYARQTSKEDGRARWDSAPMIARKIRAYDPWPGVWTLWNGQVVKILQAAAAPPTGHEPPGTVVPLDKNRWGVRCADGIIVPSIVQFAGKKPQPADRVIGGYPGWLGSRLD